MNTFLYTIAVLYFIRALVKLIFLGRGKYPRIVQFDSSDDAFTLVVELILLGFSVYFGWSIHNA